ncbi:MAG: dihydroorotase [Clostridiales bacterium]|nr:dihydroorotase [Clostridiales bacterium]
MSDLAVEDGRIVRIDPSIPVTGFDAVYQLSHLYLIPGFVDVHVHLREPGFSYKETIASGTAAAARAGYTAVCTMPNLNPAPDSPAHLEVQNQIIRETAAIPVYPYASITLGQSGGGELVDFDALAALAVGFSDDGVGVQSGELMKRAMLEAARTGSMVVAHCEDETLLHGGYIHDGVYAKRHGHRGIGSESEWRQVERDLALAKETGCRYHVCHVSTRESVALIRQAKREGVNVTCETAPHYLVLTDEDLQEHGRFKMNPPIRGAADRDALLAGIQDGTVDMIDTDHAPHSAEEKSRGLEKSAMGVVGLETAFPVLYTHLVKKGIISLARLVELMCLKARGRFRLPGGRLAAGEPADFAVLDLERRFTVNPNQFLTKGRFTPFDGWAVQGETRMPGSKGRIVWNNLQEK